MNERQRRFGWALIGVLIGSLVMLLVASILNTNRTVATIRDSQQIAIKNREANDKILEAIESCTTPGRKCFRESQRRTAKVVADINQVTVLAAVCAANAPSPTVPVIEECIRRQLEAVAGR